MLLVWWERCISPQSQAVQRDRYLPAKYNDSSVRLLRNNKKIKVKS